MDMSMSEKADRTVVMRDICVRLTRAAAALVVVS